MRTKPATQNTEKSEDGKRDRDHAAEAKPRESRDRAAEREEELPATD
jgi:hypothetical protein